MANRLPNDFILPPVGVPFAVTAHQPMVSTKSVGYPSIPLFDDSLAHVVLPLLVGFLYGHVGNLNAASSAACTPASGAGGLGSMPKAGPLCCSGVGSGSARRRNGGIPSSAAGSAAAFALLGPRVLFGGVTSWGEDVEGWPKGVSPP